MNATPREIVGSGGVRAIRLAAPDGTIDEVSTGLVLRSIGYRGRPFGVLPFDQTRGTVANDGGRVIDHLLRTRRPGVMTGDDWFAIDRHERGAGRKQNRPCVKLLGLTAVNGRVR